MVYFGDAPIDGMTDEQAAACEAAARSAPPEWHDGLMRAIADQLSGNSPPWSNIQVRDAIAAVFDEHGLTLPSTLK